MLELEVLSRFGFIEVHGFYYDRHEEHEEGETVLNQV